MLKEDEPKVEAPKPSAPPAKETKEAREAREAKELMEREAFEKQTRESASHPIVQLFNAIKAQQFQLLKQRLSRLQARAESEFSEASAAAEQIFQICDGAITSRVKGENEAIETLIALVREHIERELPLQHPLQLQGEDLYVKRDQLSIDPTPAVVLSPLAQSLQHVSLCTPSQILQLVNSCSASQLSTSEAVSLFQRLVASSHSSAVPFLPSQFNQLSPATFSRLVSAFTSPSHGLFNVNWRRLVLCTFILPLVGVPSLQDLLLLRRNALSSQLATLRKSAHSTIASPAPSAPSSRPSSSLAHAAPQSLPADDSSAVAFQLGHSPLQELLLNVESFSELPFWFDNLPSLRAFGDDAAVTLKQSLARLFVHESGSVFVGELLQALSIDDAVQTGAFKAISLLSTLPGSLGVHDVASSDMNPVIPENSLPFLVGFLPFNCSLIVQATNVSASLSAQHKASIEQIIAESGAIGNCSFSQLNQSHVFRSLTSSIYTRPDLAAIVNSEVSSGAAQVIA